MIDAGKPRRGVVQSDRGPVQQVGHGHWFFPMDPKPEDVYLNDIVVSLCGLPRFLRHTIFPYYVGQHSVLVSWWVEENGGDHIAQLQGLLHDASEFVIGDISSPMKQVIESIAPGAMAKIERPIEKAIFERFGLGWPMHAIVHDADIVMLATEKRDILVPTDTYRWAKLPLPWDRKIMHGWNEQDCRAIFYDRFNALYSRINRSPDPQTT